MSKKKMTEQEKLELQNPIRRLEHQRVPYIGDGINPEFTTTEVLVFLRMLQNKNLTGS
jgi:hypothetical protein